MAILASKFLPAIIFIPVVAKKPVSCPATYRQRGTVFLCIGHIGIVPGFVWVGYVYSQSANIDNSRSPVFTERAPGDLKIVLEHELIYYFIIYLLAS